MNNSMLKELQGYHYSLKDADGHWRKEYIGSIYQAGTSKENIETIKKILNIIMDSDYISIETKIYIASKGISIKDVNEFINDARATKLTRDGKVLKPVSYNNTCHKLQVDNEELEMYLGNGTLRNIAYNRIEDEKATNKRLVRFKERFGENYNYRENLIITIKPLQPKVNEYMNNEEFFDILGSIEAYLVQRKDIIENAINANTEFVQYFNYLLSKQAIDNDKVQKDRERLIKFLKNEDYITDYMEDNQTEDEEEIEQFIDSANPLRKAQAEDIIVDESGMKMDSYTVWNYDMPNKIDE